MSRPSLDEYYMNMLALVASRSTCSRRAVGAIVTDERGHLIATGYNGVPSKIPHCVDVPCAGATDAKGDTSRCIAIHAETNSIVQAGDRLRDATRMYCTCSPCFSCCKLIATTNIRRIVFRSLYADREGLSLFRALGVQLFRWHDSKDEEFEPITFARHECMCDDHLEVI